MAHRTVCRHKLYRPELLLTNISVVELFADLFIYVLFLFIYLFIFLIHLFENLYNQNTAPSLFSNAIQHLTLPQLY